MPRQKKSMFEQTQASVCTTVWRVALYSRLSREDQTKGVSASITNQEAYLTHYLQHSLGEPYELVDRYSDDGVSGTTDNREHFQRMIRDIEARRVNCVIMKDLSRLARNTRDQSNYLDYFFRAYNCRFITIEAPVIDSYKNPESMYDIVVPMMGAVNEMYAGQTSKKIRSMQNFKRETGKYIGSFPPYGLMRDPEDRHHLVIDEEAAAVVRDVFRWYLQGMSVASITRKLNGQGIMPPLAYRRQHGSKLQTPHAKEDGMMLWHDRTVKHMLENMYYAGHLVQGKESSISFKNKARVKKEPEDWFITRDAHEAIVGKDDFERVQKLLKENARAFDSSVKGLFSGKIICGECGYAMNKKNNGPGRQYYQCRPSRAATGQRHLCSNKSVRQDVIEAAVLCAVQMDITCVCELEQRLQEMKNTGAGAPRLQRFDAAVGARKNKLAQLETALASLYLDQATGAIPKEVYQTLSGKYISGIEELKEQVMSLEAQQTAVLDVFEEDAPVIKNLEKYKTITQLDRAMVQQLVDKIVVYPGKHIEIYFTYAHEMRHLAALMEKDLLP